MQIFSIEEEGKKNNFIEITFFYKPHTPYFKEKISNQSNIQKKYRPKINIEKKKKLVKIFALCCLLKD